MITEITKKNPGNILVIGNSFSGKKDVIDIIMGEERTVTTFGSKKKDNIIRIYENEFLPIRLIDTPGYEPLLMNRSPAFQTVTHWRKMQERKGLADAHINMIWFCVDGSTLRYLDYSIRNAARPLSRFKNIPLIVILNKSYLFAENEKNIDLVMRIFRSLKRVKEPDAIIPIIVESKINKEGNLVDPFGVHKLLDETNRLMPVGKQVTKEKLDKYKLDRKKFFAQSIIAASVSAGAVTCAVSLPITDGIILTNIELAEVNALSWLYGINKKDKHKNLINYIIELGTVSIAARGFISFLKTIPALNVGGAVLNAVIGSSIVAGIGEASKYIFEQIYLGNRDIEDMKWVEDVMRSVLSEELVEKVKESMDQIDGDMSPQDIGGRIYDTIKELGEGNKKRKMGITR